MGGFTLMVENGHP
jgi:hypothetical protein